MTDVEKAASAIAGRVRRTPVVEAAPGIWLKLECLQHSGSFKVRGAFNRIIAADLPASGVIAASGGNHGLAVAVRGADPGRPARRSSSRRSAPGEDRGPARDGRRGAW